LNNTVLALGVACLVAAIVGGGLKAAGFEFPVLSSLPRQVVLGILGLILIAVSLRSGPKPTPTPPMPHPPKQFEVDYSERGGGFFIIGPNPSGEFSSPGYEWNAIDMVLENHCGERVYVAPAEFRLYVTTQPATANATPIMSTDRGMQYQTGHLQAGWVEDRQKVLGRLIFEVPSDPSEQAGKSARYRILRFSPQTPCSVQYRPY
jgi:hypothetical protein